MEEDKLKVYLTSINKMIRSGNPKYMSYISREYMKYMKSSPVIAEAIGDMLFKEVNINEKSPYAIFLHDNGSICLDAMSDVSKISNVAEFVGHIQELSKYDIDFNDVTPDDLILEGDEMIAELEKELDRKDLTEEDIEKVEEKAEKSLVKVGVLASIGIAISGAAQSVVSKLKAKMASLKSQKGQVPQNKAQANSQQPTNNTQNQNNGQPTKQAMTPEQVAASRLSFEQICPKVDVDEEKVIKEMNAVSAEKLEELKKKRATDTYGDGDPDGDDLDI